MALHRLSALRVTASIRNGSSRPVVVETAGGLFVVKLHGAAQGVYALIAEIIVAEVAEALGLPVPERALVELESSIPSDDRNDELADLLRASAGLNLGFRLLEGAVDLRASEAHLIDDAFAARVLWLDALVMNADRTARNTNVLLWRRQPWLIDHGATLPFQHDWAGVTEDSPREAVDHRPHLFGDRAPRLRDLDAALAQSLGREVLASAIAEVPDSFLASAFPGEDVPRLRALYHSFLWKRLKAPRPFVPV